MKLRLVCMVAAFWCSWASASQIAILVEKATEMYSAPVAGIKGAVGEALEFNMRDDTLAGKEFCKRIGEQGSKVTIAVGKNAALLAAKELPAMPIVYCMVMSPEQAGIKGDRLTGVSLDVPVSKQFAAFKSVVPGLKKIGLIYSDNYSQGALAATDAAARKAGLALTQRKVESDKDVPGAVREMKGLVDGLYLPPDRLIIKHDAFQFIALFTFENNIPFMAPTDRFVKKGALIALMIDYEEMGRQAGEMAAKIAQGTPVSSLPPEPPRVTILVLNQKTAQTIGINIPPSLLQESKIIK